MELSCKAGCPADFDCAVEIRTTQKGAKFGHSVVIGSTHCRHSRLSLSISLSLLVSFIHNNYTHSRTFTLKRQKGNMQNELGDRRDEIERERVVSARCLSTLLSQRCERFSLFNLYDFHQLPARIVKRINKTDQIITIMLLRLASKT